MAPLLVPASSPPPAPVAVHLPRPLAEHLSCSCMALTRPKLHPRLHAGGRGALLQRVGPWWVMAAPPAGCPGGQRTAQMLGAIERRHGCRLWVQAGAPARHSLPAPLRHADFRPAYLALGEVRQLFPGVPVIAVTATATQVVRRSIVGERALSAGALASACTPGPLASESRPLLQSCVGQWARPVPCRVPCAAPAELLRLKDPVQLMASFNRANIGYQVRLKELIGDGGQEAVLQVRAGWLSAAWPVTGRATPGWLSCRTLHYFGRAG